MLSKLIKYDIKSTWRDFAGIYMCILLGVIIVPLILENTRSEIVRTSAGFVAFSIVIAVIVITILNLFKIFNKNVYAKEGYLTMTLPVTSGQIIKSKLFVSTMWIVLTGLVSIIGIFIFSMIIAENPFTEVIKQINAFLEIIGKENTFKVVFTVLLLGLSIVISTVKEIAKLFLACSIAHLKQLNRFSVPAGILSYFIISWLETVIVQLAMLVITFSSNHLADIITRIDSAAYATDFLPLWGYFSAITVLGVLYSLLLTVLYSLGTVWFLNRKLDLD